MSTALSAGLDLDVSDLGLDSLSITSVRDAIALPETGASSGSSSCDSCSCCGSCSCCAAALTPVAHLGAEIGHI